MPPQSWKRALILGDNHIGDILYRTASLQGLRAGLPHCDLYYLTSPTSVDLLVGNPNIKAALPWLQSDSMLDVSAEHMKQLRAMQFDVALCTNCIRYWSELLLAVRLGIPARVGYTYKGLSGLVTHPIPISYPKPFAHYFRDYVSTLTGRQWAEPVTPAIYLDEQSKLEADQVWRRLSLTHEDRVIACFVTSRQDTAGWPVRRYRALFEMISRRLSVRIVLLGAKEDGVELDSIVRGCDCIIDVCAGDLKLRALAAFVQKCSLVLAKDSGPRHIANAVGTKVLFFRSGSFSEVEAGRYCDNESDLSPTGEFLTKEGQEALLARVQVEDVFTRVEALLHLS
jgi:ADP-heptose:LPS heptosyltransferase